MTTLVIALFACFCASEFQDSKYLELEISEKKLDNGKIEFALQKAELSPVRHGRPEFTFEKGSTVPPNCYLLETYSKDKKLIGQYMIYSARFFCWDGYPDKMGRPTGGMKELETGVMYLVLRHDTNNPVQYIKIHDKGKATDYLRVSPSN